MPLFDEYLMVDWSASNTPNSGKNAIWWAHAGAAGEPECGNPRTRGAAMAQIVSKLDAARGRKRRLLVGFDFPFGYPRGFARAVGKRDWRGVWALIAHRITDDDRNCNNRFSVAGTLNQMSFNGEFPFWGQPWQHSHTGLPRFRPSCSLYAARELPQWRHVEKQPDVGNPKSVWQLNGRGTVGGQMLVGIARLEQLRCQRSEIAVWPFEQERVRDAPVILAEIYPSLPRFARGQGQEQPRDRAQVLGMVRALRAADRAGALEAMLFPALARALRRDVAREEAWILGVP